MSSPSSPCHSMPMMSLAQTAPTTIPSAGEAVRSVCACLPSTMPIARTLCSAPDLVHDKATSIHRVGDFGYVGTGTGTVLFLPIYFSVEISSKFRTYSTRLQTLEPAVGDFRS